MAGGGVIKAHRLQTNATDYAVNLASGAGTLVIEAKEIYAPYTAVYYAATGGAILKIFGARIKSGGTGSTGRAININSSSASNKVRLFGCTLVAGGDFSVNSTNPSIQVHATSGVGINKGVNTFVTWLPTTAPTNDTSID